MAVPQQHIFLSHSSKDHEFCVRLVEDLRRLFGDDDAVWYDANGGLYGGDAWWHKIEQELNTRTTFIVVLSPDAMDSDWVNDEIDIAWRRKNHPDSANRMRLIPVLYRPCEIRPGLESLQIINFQPPKSYEAALQEILIALNLPPRSVGSQSTLSAPQNRPVSAIGQTGSSVIPRRDRKMMLERVHNSWIRGLLEQSLEGADVISIDLYERPDLVSNPLKPVLQEIERPAHGLPADTRITQVYNEASGQLLILGNPGSGKTTLLLQLARDLLDRAERDDEQQMPVVFALSTWAIKRQPLAEWLIEELSTRYQIPKKVGRVWVGGGHVLPLLDGLDEVAEEHREACVGAINAYRQAYGLVPLVVSSRITEYSALATKVIVSRAIIAQPLTPQKISAYLAGAKGQLEVLQTVLREDPSSQELIKTPLMLSILKSTYQGKPVEAIVKENSAEAWRHQIFTAYVERMLQRRRSETHYTQEQTIYWLTWLAKQMGQREQTEFYLERLQIDWSPDSRRCELYTSLAFGLPSILIATTVYGIEFGNFWNGLFVGFLDAVIAILFVWFIERDIHVGALFGRMNRGKPIVARERKKSNWYLKLTALFTQILGERAGFAFLSGVFTGALVEFLVGPYYGLVNGVFLGAFLVVLGKFEKQIQPAEILVWSWKSVWRNALKSLIQGLIFGFLLGFFDAYPYFSQLRVFLTTLSFGLSVGFAMGLVMMVMRGFSSNMLDMQQTMKPNQGIRNSLSNSMRLGLVAGLALGLVIFFLYSVVIHRILVVGYIDEIPRNSGIVYGVSDGLAVAYLFWLINGGFACVQHFILRVHLWRARSTPWNYSRFLDYTHERIFLRKVGGGYVFIHKLLLEYFASLDLQGDSTNSSEKAADVKEDTNALITLLSETVRPTSEDATDVEEDTNAPTVPLVLTSVRSDTPRLLPCGHEQYASNMRFCSICGAPTSL